MIEKNKPALTISRLPENTLKQFKSLADEEFCSDYGMTLKFLITEVMEQSRYIELDKRITNIEQKIEGQTKKEELTTLSGRKIR